MEKRRYNLKKIFLMILLLSFIIVLYFLMSNYDYFFKKNKYEYYYIEVNHDKSPIDLNREVRFSLIFKGTKYSNINHTENKMNIYYIKSPYNMYFSLNGPFESVKNFKAHMKIEGGKTIELNISDQKLNSNKKINEQQNNEIKIFGNPEPILLDLDVENIKEIEVTISFEGIANGRVSNYELTKYFKIVKKVDIESKFLHNLEAL
jgi:hypothetical protein